MPYFETSQEWVEQSSLLLQAYPTSTIITTKYKNIPPIAIESRKRKADKTSINSAQHNTTSAAASTTNAVPPTPKATLILKSYDPVSGACLKYRTDKAAEVGRLVASLGRLGRHMAALPEIVTTEDLVVAGQQERAEAVSEMIVQRSDGKADGGLVEGRSALPAAAAANSGTVGGAPAKKKKKGKK